MKLVKYFQAELEQALAKSSAHTSKDDGLLDALRRVKVLYSDIDGTVLGRRGCLLVDGNNQPSATAARSIVEANLHPGFEVVPCTGRSVTQLIEISRLLGWDDFIGEAGAVRSYWHADKGERENIYDTPGWSADIQARICEKNTPLNMINASGAMDALFAFFPGQIEYHSPWNVNRQATNVLRGRVDAAQANLLFADFDLPITLVENGVIAPSAHTLIESDEPIRAYHLTPTGVTKGGAIKADLARRGYSKDEALMIGDGMADLECGEYVAAVFMLQNSLRSPQMETALAKMPNAYLMEGSQGDGWAQLVRAIIKSKSI